MDFSTIMDYGRKIYDCKRWINYRCVAVFAVRYLINKSNMDKMVEFFTETPIRKQFLDNHPKLFAQLSRQWIFRGSTNKERLDLMLSSWQTVEKIFSDEALKQIYWNEKEALVLWRSSFREEEMRLELNFLDGEIKEGCMTISLVLGEKSIYHINFWMSPDKENFGEVIAYIGCHQGSRDGLGINKELTKFLFGSRPKNFIFWALKTFLMLIGVKKLRAVSNYGFYANNHIRKDRKLKVSYDDFWAENDGVVMADKRFYSLPMEDKRKEISDLPTKKRATYRKRYALLDEVSRAMEQVVADVKR